MKNTDRSTAGQPPITELDELLTPEERRTCSVAQHAAFRESLATPKPLDPIDELVAELRATQPEGFDQ